MAFSIIPIAEASGGVVSLVNSINKVIINPLIVFIFALAIFYFIFALAKYLMNPDSEELRKSSKQQMLWGVIGMFIMVGVFGILNIIIKTWGEEDKIKIQNGSYEIDTTKLLE